MNGKAGSKPTIAVFDFDGTLFKGDSLYHFSIFALGKRRFYTCLIKNIPNIAAWKLGLRSNSEAKQKLFQSLFGGMEKSRFLQLCEDFEKVIDLKINPETYNSLKRHVAEGHKVYIVSASPAEWIKPWSAKKGVTDVIGTVPEYRDNKLSGRFSSPNCYGKEKVTRFLSKEPDRSAYRLVVYGDSRGDKEMFEASDRGVRR